MARPLLPLQHVFSLDDRDDPAQQGAIAPEIDALARFAVELGDRLGASGLTGLSGAVELHRRMLAALDGVSREDLDRMIAHVATLAEELKTVAEHLKALRVCKSAIDQVAEPAGPETNSVNRPIR